MSTSADRDPTSAVPTKAGEAQLHQPGGTAQWVGLKDLASRLYRGEAGVDVVGRRKIFYGVAAGILLVAILTALVRPFNVGIEFRGGNAFTVPASVGSLADVRTAVEDAGVEVASAQVLGGAKPSYLIKTAVLDPDDAAAARKAQAIKADLAERYDIRAEEISENAVSGAWGASITRQALIGTAVFLVLVVIYLTLVFREWKMAVAALAALVQNLVLTAAIYLLVGFEVTPSTVIGFLTILGFALYDVVVVFDKVRENTRGITGNATRTYGEAANLAVNQTLMRSINTAIVALLPVGGLLFIGAGLLGAGTLKDLGLVLFVGMLAAVYSSIFFATPVLVDLKLQEPVYRLHTQRVLARRAAGTGTERKVRSPVRRGSPTGAVADGSPVAGGPVTTDVEMAAQAEREKLEKEPVTMAPAGGTAPRASARPQQARKRPSGARPSGARSRKR